MLSLSDIQHRISINSLGRRIRTMSLTAASDSYFTICSLHSQTWHRMGRTAVKVLHPRGLSYLLILLCCLVQNMHSTGTLSSGEDLICKTCLRPVNSYKNSCWRLPDSEGLVCTDVKRYALCMQRPSEFLSAAVEDQDGLPLLRQVTAADDAATVASKRMVRRYRQPLFRIACTTLG